MRSERYIRLLPSLLIIAAIADFVKQGVFIASYWKEVRYFNALGGHEDLFWKVAFDLIERGFGLVLYPLAWVVSAVTIHLLLEIYDQRRAANA